MGRIRIRNTKNSWLDLDPQHIISDPQHWLNLSNIRGNTHFYLVEEIHVLHQDSHHRLLPPYYYYYYYPHSAPRRRSWQTAAAAHNRRR